jgi:hypothetical protein
VCVCVCVTAQIVVPFTTWPLPAGGMQMRAFALKGYRSAEALPFYQAPNSLLGRVLGWLHGYVRAPLCLLIATMHTRPHPSLHGSYCCNAAGAHSHPSP